FHDCKVAISRYDGNRNIALGGGATPATPARTAHVEPPAHELWRDAHFSRRIVDINAGNRAPNTELVGHEEHSTKPPRLLFLLEVKLRWSTRRRSMRVMEKQSVG